MAYRSNATSSEAESSGDDCDNWKRGPTTKVDDNDSKTFSSKNQKYKNTKIWSNLLQEEVLTNTLQDCGLKKSFKKDRGPESYDYKSLKRMKMGHADDREEQSDYEDSNKDESFNFATELKKVKIDVLVKEIIKTLNERKHSLIKRTVVYLGPEKSKEILEATMEVEKNGGMLISNGNRRRTPGGVFFTLLRSKDQNIPKETLKKIFEIEEKKAMELKKNYKNFKKNMKKRKKTNENRRSTKVSFPQADHQEDSKVLNTSDLEEGEI